MSHLNQQTGLSVTDSHSTVRVQQNVMALNLGLLVLPGPWSCFNSCVKSQSMWSLEAPSDVLLLFGWNWGVFLNETFKKIYLSKMLFKKKKSLSKLCALFQNVPHYLCQSTSPLNNSEDSRTPWTHPAPLIKTESLLHHKMQACIQLQLPCDVFMTLWSSGCSRLSVWRKHTRWPSFGISETLGVRESESMMKMPARHIWTLSSEMEHD